MSYREQFIAAWVTQQQRAFHQSTRGIMTPEDRQILEDEAEKAMAEVEREAAEKAELALQRVRELHTPAERWVPANEEKPWRGFIRDGDKCESCNQVYPCLTIKALEGDE